MKTNKILTLGFGLMAIAAIMIAVFGLKARGSDCVAAETGATLNGVTITGMTSYSQPVTSFTGHETEHWSVTLNGGSLISNYGGPAYNDLVNDSVFWIDRVNHQVCAVQVHDVNGDQVFDTELGARLPGDMVIIQMETFDDEYTQVTFEKSSQLEVTTPEPVSTISSDEPDAFDSLPMVNFDQYENAQFVINFPGQGMGEFQVLDNRLYQLVGHDQVQITEYNSAPAIELVYINHNDNVVIAGVEYEVPTSKDSPFPGGARYAHEGNGHYFALTTHEGFLMIYNRHGLVNQIDAFGWPTELWFTGSETAAVIDMGSFFSSGKEIDYVHHINVVTGKILASWPILKADGSIPGFNTCDPYATEAEYFYYMCRETVYDVFTSFIQVNLATGEVTEIDQAALPDDKFGAAEDMVVGESNHGKTIATDGGWVVQSQNSVWFVPVEGEPTPLLGAEDISWWNLIGVIE